MLQLTFGEASVRRLLVLGAHADDIEIGCGGTILTLTRAIPSLEVTWVVLAATGEREREAVASAEAFLADAATADIVVHGFRDGFLPYVGGEVKEVFEGLRAHVEPDLVLTHTSDDMHQDHRLVWELTWNTFRDHLVLEYEIPKYDGDLGRPSVYVPLTEPVATEKIELLGRHFPSQASKHWFDPGIFRGLMRLRGMEANAPEGLAEGFTARKVRLSP